MEEAEPLEAAVLAPAAELGALVWRVVLGLLVLLVGVRVGTAEGDSVGQAMARAAPRARVGDAVRRSPLDLEAEPALRAALGILLGILLGTAVGRFEAAAVRGAVQREEPPVWPGTMVGLEPCTMKELVVGTRVGKKVGVAGRLPQ